MIIIENKSTFENSQLIQMARRENNTKRSFLIVNPSQAKHIPAKPSQSMELFRQLSDELKKYTGNDNILFIGFAETATAIGVGVASNFENSDYIHTTREKIENAEMVVEFKELHSHAVQQTLQCSDWDSLIKNKNHIVFVEDEISTGTTIMNFVNALRDGKKVPQDMQFSVASIINGMSAEREKELAEQGVLFRYLMKISMENHQDTLYNSDAKQLEKVDTTQSVKFLNITDYNLNPRKGLKTADYIKSIDDIVKSVMNETGDLKNKKIAVIGTEECMYPAIYTACKIEEKYNPELVVTHSTTRSPVEPHDEESYPLKSRAVLESFYDSKRVTYIYNTYYKYDLVIVITDAPCENKNSIDKFLSAFSQCSNFLIVRCMDI